MLGVQSLSFPHRRFEVWVVLKIRRARPRETRAVLHARRTLCLTLRLTVLGTALAWAIGRALPGMSVPNLVPSCDEYLSLRRGRTSPATGLGKKPKPKGSGIDCR